MSEGKRGRPRTEFDLKQVEAFGYIGSTREEMADYFGCTVRTIQNYMADTKSEFFQSYKSGDARGKESLRRVQMQKAEAGNVTMLIWLGKQRLGQTDVNKLDVTTGGDKLNTKVEITAVDPLEAAKQYAEIMKGK